MGSVSRRPTRVESAASICLLGVIVAVGIGLLLKQARVDMARFGTDPVAAGVVQPQTDKAGQEGLSLGSLAPESFEKLSQETYDPGNLYEKIDGKAPLYLDAGFVKLLTVRFIDEQDQSLWMELFVYDMAELRNAFSVYGVQRRADVEVLPEMQFAYRTSNGLYFVHGKYYIELVGSSESDRLFQAMKEVGRRLRDTLPVDEAVQISELSVFPQQHLVPGSHRLYLKSAFGFEKLTNIFTARYKIGQEYATAFMSRTSSAENAQNKATAYYDFLIENGAVDKSLTNAALQAVNAKILDFYGTTEIVFAVGPYLGGVHEAENQEPAEWVAAELANKLGQAKKAMGDESAG